jgi:hypothetical protein
VATNYPAALDTVTQLPNTWTDATLSATTHATVHNNISDSIRAIETELGADPSGSFTSVASRLNARLTCRKTADTTNATVTLANVTDMVLPVATTGLDYYFYFYVIWTTSTLGNTAQFAVTVPAVTGYISYWIETMAGTTTVPTATGDLTATSFVSNSFHNASASATAAAGAASGTSPPALTTNYMTRISGILSNPSATGNIQLQHRSETAVITTCKRGSYGEVYIN